MAGQDSFQQRLKRLEHKNGEHRPAPSIDFSDSSPAQRPLGNARKPNNNGIVFKLMVGFVAIVGVIIVGSGAFMFKAMAGVSAQADLRTTGVVGAPNSWKISSTKPSQRVVDYNDPKTLSDRLMIATTKASLSYLESKSVEEYSDGGEQPFAFLPAAPRGNWIRITTADTSKSDAIGHIENRWAAETRKPASALHDHPGFKQLQRYMTRYAGSDMGHRMRAHSKSEAFYMHPDGRYVLVGLHFLNAGDALGQKSDSTRWIEQLQSNEERSGPSGFLLESVRLNGSQAINRMLKHDPVSMRGLGRSANMVNAIVPVSHRSVMYMEGFSRVSDLETLLRSTNKSALLARHN